MKQQTKAKWIKGALRLVALASLATACGAFYGWPTTQVLRIQPAPTLTFLVVLLLTPLVGRFFCDWLCPLGIFQSVVHFLTHPKSHVRRVCTRLPETKVQRVVRWSVFVIAALLVAAGFGALGWAITPYSILGKALVGVVPGIVLAAVVLALATLGHGRIWCNWICPIGTLFNLLAKGARLPDRIDGRAGCGNCKRCFGKAVSVGGGTPTLPNAKVGLAPRASRSEEGDPCDGVTRRAVLAGAGAVAASDLLAAEKTVDGGFAPISLPGLPERDVSVLPPGAVDRALFNRLCVGCELCAKACPEGVIVPSMNWRNFGHPQLDFRKSHCRLACPQKCAAACPAGALRLFDNLPRRDLHAGVAVWQKDRCLRATEDVPCTACSRKCPVKAITIVGGFPVVNRDVCIGCGACEHVCPSRPMPAMVVQGYERQRIVRPMDVADQIAEMKSVILRGEAVLVVAKNGVISARENGRGVQPLFKLFDTNGLRDAVVVDKVIGRAAAAVCVAGGAKRVHGCLMSEEAKVFLEKNGVRVSADTLVPKILNRDRSASCPLEATVLSLDDPAKMVEALKCVLKK
jgi:polyferredoxin